MHFLNRKAFEDGDSRTAEFQGGGFGTPVSFFLVDNDPGQGPVLHEHDYPETWIVQHGQADFTVAGETIGARSGDILIVPPYTPHKFINKGSGRLEMVCIHASGHIIQRDLEEQSDNDRS